MTDYGAFSGLTGAAYRSQAGIISKIRLENFMCHSNLEIEFGDWVNFITGRNGSGKSAILTALCVAFGCRAKGTQRAATLKDFIKTGCSYAVVYLEIKNQGDDAFKPDVYGDVITIERRISETTSSTVLKNHQGRKVAGRKEDLRELIEHFNIDVENPCVIMSQDKSREFLHSGNDKDKFKFFFKATLLHQVDDLLKGIRNQLENANEVVGELESSIRPIEKELNELQMKIKNMEHIEEITQQVQLLKKKLAWSWVYDVDKQIQEQNAKIETLKSRIPKCQTRIDRQIVLCYCVEIQLFLLAPVVGFNEGRCVLCASFTKIPFGGLEGLETGAGGRGDL
ncbi:Structural maintenance of chromosomes protein 6A [Sarracenia purpurea var. burkii]